MGNGDHQPSDRSEGWLEHSRAKKKTAAEGSAVRPSYKNSGREPFGQLDIAHPAQITSAQRCCLYRGKSVFAFGDQAYPLPQPT